jgi:hypothetical protein
VALGRRDITIGLGAGALALFVTMAVILQVAIKPVTGFLPQAAPVPYDASAIAEFGNTLKAEGLVALYRSVLVYMDTAFFTLFALWVLAGHIWPSTVRLRWVGVILAASIVLLEGLETAMIVEASGLDVSEPIVVETLSGNSPIYVVTLAKYTVYMACLVSMWWMAGRSTPEGDA